MNLALIAANIIIFLLSHSFSHLRGPGGVPLQLPGDLTPGWDKFMLNGGGTLHLFQFITYQFLHMDLPHIGFNMLFLYVFGNNLNEKLGHLAYLVFYLVGGVCAGCGQMFFEGGATLGASGSISAVAGLFLVLLPLTHIRILVWLIGTVWEIPSMYFILFKIGQDVFEQIMGGGHVAYMAHISGTLAGFLIGLLLLGAKLVQRDHYDLLSLITRERRRHAYRAVIAQGYNPYDVLQNSPVRAGAATRRADGEPDPRILSLRSEISRLLQLHESADAATRYRELLVLDGLQVLPPQEQMDVASQLMAEKNYQAAAKAFEDYLRTYPTGGAGQQEQITLMLALIYSQYLPNLARARELYSKVLPRLHDPKDREMAEAELRRLEAAGT
ncbi:MAG TPA: rhomboid family intramembrane serine protease [Phycisphaerae bacterium]|jgi:membrane associated rhomboid family serine protease|nr:rhomboid family intramembrane serine protease [Phycisphaerae bacterium]